MGRHFATSRPRRTCCRRCGRVTVGGLDEGLPYRVDPVPLTVLGELSAVTAGRATFRVVAGCLARRWSEQITAETATSRPAVYAEHRCDAPPEVAHIDPARVVDALRLLASATDPAPGLPVVQEEPGLFTGDVEPAPF